MMNAPAETMVTQATACCTALLRPPTLRNLRRLRFALALGVFMSLVVMTCRRLSMQKRSNTGNTTQLETNNFYRFKTMSTKNFWVFSPHSPVPKTTISKIIGVVDLPILMSMEVNGLHTAYGDCKGLRGMTKTLRTPWNKKYQKSLAQQKPPKLCLLHGLAL